MIKFNGEKLQEMLKNRRWKCEEFTNKLNARTQNKFTRQTISNLLTGKTANPHTNLSLAIAFFFGMDVEQWFIEKEESGLRGGSSLGKMDATQRPKEITFKPESPSIY